MAASKTKKKGNGDKVIKPVNSVHIVIFSCPNCGEELEELKLCNECDSPMKVVQVIEKYGSEADEYLEQLKKEGSWGAGNVRPAKKKESDGGISGDDLEELDIPITGLQEEKESEEPSNLGEIFPDKEDEDESSKDSNKDIDFMEALEKLDEEDDVEDMHDLGPDGLPEL